MVVRPASSRLQGLVTLSGMVAVIGALSMAPRVSITRTEDSVVVKYDRLKRTTNPVPPADRGVIITPGPPPAPATASADGSTAHRKKPFTDTDWIFDTGATTHVCTNRALLHSYVTLNPFNNSAHPRAVGHFGPNPIPIVGVGDCTLTLPELSSSTSIAQSTNSSSSLQGTGTPLPQSASPGFRVGLRVTLRGISHIPSAGVNLISWSQLKRAKGFNGQLVEERDGSLTVRDGRNNKALMRFELRDGLYFLVQAPNPTEYAEDGRR